MLKLMIDMDGPLADFEAAVGIPVGHPERGDNFKDFPQMFEKGFFGNLPVTPGAKESIDWLLSLREYDISICSKPVSRSGMESFYSASEKYEWISKNFPCLIEKMTLTYCKGNMSGDILVDDSLKWQAKFQGVFLHFDVKNPEESWRKIRESLLPLT